MELEYDETKRQLTLINRGLDFARAEQVFGKFNLTREDDRRDYSEERYQTTGLYDEIIVMVVWTLRSPRRRIISMRRCDNDERQEYQRERDALDRP